jgi:hypothetical protein
MDDNTDIVERIRSMYYELNRRQASTPFGERSELNGIPELLYEAATKIHDLRGNEIERLRKERDEAMALIENIANEVNVLSTRPAAIIKFSDLVDQINEWGDAARKILGSKENTDG